MKKLMLLVIVIVIICSCKKEVNESSNEFVNPYKPQVKSTKLTLESSTPLHEDFYSGADFFIIDDNIYTLNTHGKMAIITNFQGEMVKLIDAIGQGPGEFEGPLRIFDDRPLSRIGISDLKNDRVSYFDYDGKHLEDIKSKTLEDDSAFYYCGEARVRDYSNLVINKLTGNMYSENKLDIVTGKKDINIFKSILQISNPDGKWLELYPSVATSDEQIYIHTISYDNYEVQVFNPDGTHYKNFKKEFKKIKLTKDEIAEREESIGREIEPDDFFELHKWSISRKIVDEKGQLWVQSIDDEGSVWDIFDKEGRIISQARIEDYSFGKSYFYNNKLYEINTDEEDDEQYILNVYRVD